MKHLFAKLVLAIAAAVVLSACEFSKCCGVVTRKEFVPTHSKIVVMPAYKTMIPRRVSYPARWVVWVGKQPLTVSKTLYESLGIGDSVYYYLNGQIIRTSHLEPTPESNIYNHRIKKHDCGRKRVSRTDQPCGKKGTRGGRRASQALPDSIANIQNIFNIKTL